MPTYQQKIIKGFYESAGVFLFAAACAVLFIACSEIEKPQTQPFYAEVKPPAKQEFRWSNGKSPKSLDPARAAAAPETDIVRALFEGLTEINPTTFQEAPAVAEKWTSSDDFRTWTFQLRREARWSNGKGVTAEDFVTSWKRLAELGEKAAHRELFQNIVGLRTLKFPPVAEPTDFLQATGFKEQSNDSPKPTRTVPLQETAAPGQPENAGPEAKTETKRGEPRSAPSKLGVEALNETTLKVTLEMPDKDFPKLVANPIFRPVYDNGIAFESNAPSRDIVTNGPFKIANIGKEGIVLDRSETYWQRSAVNLEQVQFVPKDSAEAALDAYKKGEIDAVTNAEFAPLALKLLAPYDDFRRTAHSALNFYEFNTKNAPFSDRRIREALSISIDRERLATGELAGTAQPALSFLPLGSNRKPLLLPDIVRAKQLFEDAGYLNGANFPAIRLLINRNDTQQRVARAVARMWKQNLNLDTDIIVKDLSGIDALQATGEYDLVRRGVVLPTVDEMASLSAIFGSPEKAEPTSVPKERQTSDGRPTHDKLSPAANEHTVINADKNVIVTEEQAAFELTAIPLYYPMSYALVKPYVKGFEINGLDAVMLNDISIDNNWQQQKP